MRFKYQNAYDEIAERHIAREQCWDEGHIDADESTRSCEHDDVTQMHNDIEVLLDMLDGFR